MLVLKSMMHKMSDAQIISLWSEGTNAEIVNILNQHYAGDIDLTEYWSVGDERKIKLPAIPSKSYANLTSEAQDAQEITLVISEVGGKNLTTPINEHTECAFQVDVKECLLSTGAINGTQTFTGGWTNCGRRAWCNDSFYNAFPKSIINIFKQFTNNTVDTSDGRQIKQTQDYFALRSESEIVGTSYATYDEGKQIKYYETSLNRIKHIGTSVNAYWCRTTAINGWCGINGEGDSYSTIHPEYLDGIAPFGCI